MIARSNTAFDRPWKAAAARVVGRPVAVGAAARVGARGLVLLYHRVTPEATSGPHVVPTVSPDVLRQHLTALQDAGQIVPLDELLTGDSHRPRFAITFDDDYASHARHALQILVDLGVSATFFLCGRSLSSGKMYWWEALERLLESRGLAAARSLLDMPGASSTELLEACEQDPGRQARLTGTCDKADHLDAGMLRALADAGMTVGFHTLHHPLLPPLADDDLRRAVTEGKAALEAALGRSLTLFAYPHGQADRRVASAVRAAGYAAAFTGEPVAYRPGDDPHLIGRWEPGAIHPSALLAKAAARLARRRRAP